MTTNWRNNQEEKTKDQREVDDINDMFDALKTVLKVNSPITTMNPDFIMSTLTPDILQNNVVTYVRQQLQIIEIINLHLCSPRIHDQNPEDETTTEDEECRQKINQILLNEVYTLVILSRGKNGQVIQAILDYLRANNTPTPTETPPKENLLQKIGLQKKNEETK